MKVPLSWLKEYIEVDASAAEIAERLTFSGMEVESISRVGHDYTGIVVGEVLSVEPHPRADLLRVCRVSDGSGELTVVCGATNFSVGDKAPLATVGARLPDGTAIKQVRIRGQLSDGMLCAEDELDISDDHGGIMLLPRDTAPGTPFAELMGPPEDVIELEITWNRPDCLSVIGVAREVAALYGLSLKLPSVDYPESDVPAGELIRIDVEDPIGCPRYTARVLQDIRLGPSPLWLQRRLALSGVRPISNVVDITNYVMLECGQPLHAFDHERLGEGRIVVRRARRGEILQTLDGLDRDIDPETLVIADGCRPVAVAGIMGGLGSEIGESTQRVLLESACFDPAMTHRTSCRLGLSTESSHRFERGVDMGGADWASRRAAALMVELAGASAAGGVIDRYPGSQTDRRVSCRFGRVRSLIGVDIADDDIVSILESLQLPVESRDDSACSVRVPSFRGDLQIEADLIEEVARIHGLADIPAAAPSAVLTLNASNGPAMSVIRCRRNLVGLGLNEIVNYSFVSSTLLDLFGADEAGSRVVLPNPVSRDHDVLRDSLAPQMVECLGRNLARQVERVAFFEMGRVFAKRADGAIDEEERVCIGLMGRMDLVGDRRRPVSAQEMFLWAKGIVESLCLSQRVGSLSLEAADDARFEEGQRVRIHSAEGGILGVLGIVREGIRQHWRLVEPVAVAELKRDALLKGADALINRQPAGAYPGVSRDVAVIVDESVRHEDVLHVIEETAPAELTCVELFDIFRSNRIGHGRKSLAYSMTYRSLERTLTDEEANGFHETVRNALKSRLNAEIREG